jgi:hypothetical protein
LKVGIVGSRRRLDRKAVEELVASLPLDTIIISGGCRGVDSWAAEAGRDRGLEVIEYFPELPTKNSPRWQYTKAYYNRNAQIAADSDILYAFVSKDRTGGTENTIKHAHKMNTPVHIIEADK